MNPSVSSQIAFTERFDSPPPLLTLWPCAPSIAWTRVPSGIISSRLRRLFSSLILRRYISVFQFPEGFSSSFQSVLRSRSRGRHLPITQFIGVRNLFCRFLLHRGHETRRSHSLSTGQ